MKPSIVIPVSIVIGGFIVAGAIYLAMPKGTASEGGDLSRMRPISASDHILGNPTAPVMVVEYSDFDCQYCKAFDATLHTLVADTGVDGKVAWVFRQFPLIEIHRDALALAEASECAAVAGGNQAFWNFEEALFKNQPADLSQLGSIARAAGVPSAKFASCYATASTTLAAKVMADRQNAFDMGAVGTPYSLIIAQGKSPVVVDGAYSYAALKELIDQALGS